MTASKTGSKVGAVPVLCLPPRDDQPRWSASATAERRPSRWGEPGQGGQGQTHCHARGPRCALASAAWEDVEPTDGRTFGARPLPREIGDRGRTRARGNTAERACPLAASSWRLVSALGAIAVSGHHENDQARGAAGRLCERQIRLPCHAPETAPGDGTASPVALTCPAATARRRSTARPACATPRRSPPRARPGHPAQGHDRFTRQAPPITGAKRFGPGGCSMPLAEDPAGI